MANNRGVQNLPGGGLRAPLPGRGAGMVVAADRVETSLRDQGSGTNSTGPTLP